jgi:hypothetical protein
MLPQPPQSGCPGFVASRPVWKRGDGLPDQSSNRPRSIKGNHQKQPQTASLSDGTNLRFDPFSTTQRLISWPTSS